VVSGDEASPSCAAARASDDTRRRASRSSTRDESVQLGVSPHMSSPRRPTRSAALVSTIESANELVAITHAAGVRVTPLRGAAKRCAKLRLWDASALQTLRRSLERPPRHDRPWSAREARRLIDARIELVEVDPIDATMIAGPPLPPIRRSGRHRLVVRVSDALPFDYLGSERAADRDLAELAMFVRGRLTSTSSALERSETHPHRFTASARPFAKSRGANVAAVGAGQLRQLFRNSQPDQRGTGPPRARPGPPQLS